MKRWRPPTSHSRKASPSPRQATAGVLKSTLVPSREFIGEGEFAKGEEGIVVRGSIKPFVKVLLLPLFVLWLCASSADALDIRITKDRLTLHADQAPLQTILKRVADFGITVRVDPQINPLITASFEERDIQKGLDSILKGLNHVLIWKAIQGPLGPIPRLAEIQVFTPGEEKRMRPLVRRTRLSIARNPEDGTLFVKDEILLRLNPEAALSDLKKILEKIKGTVIESYPALGIYKIRLPAGSDVPAVAQAVTELAGAEKAEPNYAYPIQEPSRAEESVPFSPELSNTGAPQSAVPVAVLDTGLTMDAGLDDFVLASMDALNPDEPITDSLGHGTQMALVASGVVKPLGAKADSETQSPIIPIKVFDEKGYTSNFLVMRSIDFALSHGARVMSLSWGSETKSEFLERALNGANAKGLIIVASAGNEPTGKPVYPAAYESVIGVGAVGPEGKRWDKSNHGDFVSLYAPGFADLPVGYLGDPGPYAGTSISAAFVANVIANMLYWKPDATRQGVLEALGARP